jgi:hypothetical protein
VTEGLHMKMFTFVSIYRLLIENMVESGCSCQAHHPPADYVMSLGAALGLIRIQPTSSTIEVTVLPQPPK